MDFTLNDNGCKMNINGCYHNSARKLSVYDWMCDLPDTVKDTDFVEVQFKNTRKGFYLNSTHIALKKGDRCGEPSNAFEKWTCSDLRKKT